MTVGSSTASGSKPHLPPKPPKRDKEPLVSPLNPNLNPNPSPNLGPSSMPIEGSDDDATLAHTEALSREDVLRRRSRGRKQLLKTYRRLYWALAEEIKVKHRDYYWEFGKSPLEEEENVNGGELGFGLGANGGDRGEERKKCAFSGCKSKAMPLTRFCHQHILSDSKQTLYKPCTFVTKSAPSVHLTCGKPVLRSTVPCLCPVHHLKIQKQISLALKKAGVSAPSSSKAAPKFHVLVSETVKQIQARRRRSLKASRNADKPSASSAKTLVQPEMDIISRAMPHPMDTSSTFLQGVSLENHIGGVASPKPSSKQPPFVCSMATVK